MSNLDKLTALILLFHEMKNGEILSYSVNDEDENYEEYIGFDHDKDDFYIRQVNDGNETRELITGGQALTYLDKKIREVIE
ncbi:hypothetical protein M5X17_31155 [Paenibacillus alvei]|uniref:hypothetical protein n=1 Tax=Paenibacillus alvei TaxID=44250 RepID=UPI00227E05E8|nr:hypothetical protein [Paenibacillus alvei]MCY9738152.1 hypothetical protein [Paenibacillus alvei]